MTQPILKTHYFDPGEQHYGKWIIDAVAEGMVPFRLKRIDVYYEFDIDFNEYRVLAGAVLMSGYTIGHSERVNRFDLQDDPDAEFLKVANKMMHAFRDREDWSLASRIQLGEN